MDNRYQLRIKQILSALFIVISINSARAQWTKMEVGVDGIRDIFFTDSDTGYVAGIDGRIYKTNDGGNNWNMQNNTGQQLNSIFFPTADTGYAVSAFGDVLTTFNRGQSWSSKNLSTGDNLYKTHFINSKKGFIVGQSTSPNAAVIYNTTDAGSTWNPQYFETNSEFVSIHFPNKDTGYAAGFNFVQNNGIIMKTINGGTSWTTTDIPAPGNQLIFRGVFFVNTDTGYVVGQDIAGSTQSAVIYKTTDGGVNWNASLVANYAELYDVQFIDDNNGYAVGLNFGNTGCGTSLILKTIDGGQNWLTEPTDSTLYGLSSIHFPNATTGYTNEGCFGSGLVGSFFKIGIPILSIGITNYEASSRISLYPNPTNGKINIELPNTFSEGSLILMNIMGEKISSQKFSNQQNIALDITALESGIYFIEVDGGDEFYNFKVIKE